MKLLHAIYERRAAFKQLLLKSFRIRYRNMALGVLWSVISPLVMLGVLAFVFTYVYPSPDPRTHFPLFLLIGLVHYNAFSRIIPSATSSILEHSSILKKVAFPRIIIPLAVIVAQLLDVVILMGLLLIFTLIFGVPLTWYALWVPFAILIEVIFATGAGLMCAALNVYYRDMLYIVESWLTVFFWVTPVFYSLETIHARLPRVLYDLYLLNPLAGCIEASRAGLLHQAMPDRDATIAAVVVAFVVLGIGIAVFERLQRRFADLT